MYLLILDTKAKGRNGGTVSKPTTALDKVEMFTGLHELLLDVGESLQTIVLPQPERKKTRQKKNKESVNT